MAELLGILCVLLFLATAVTLIGHGMWVVLAVMFRALFGGDPAHDKRLCANCGRMTSIETRSCDWCGEIHDSPVRAATQDHNAFLRQIKKLENAGLIDAKTAAEITRRADLYRQRQQHKQQSPTQAVEAEIVEEPFAPQPQQTLRPPVAPPKPVFRGDSLPSDSPQKKPQPSEKIPPCDPAKPLDKPKPQAVPPRQPRANAPLPARPVQKPIQKPVQKPASTPVPKPAPVPTPAPVPAPVPAPPRRSFGQMLEAFMEERNMRWGELIGGMLFVGGGVALAISLRNKLAEIPYSQFLIFATIAAAVYGLGLYAHHRWRLATTSRGMLMIATLLTPLSFLIMADLPKEYGQLLTIAVEVISLAVFGLLLWATMKVLVPKGRILGTVGVLGQSALMLGLARLNWAQLGENTHHIWIIVAMGLLPSAIFATVVLSYVRQYKTGDESTASRRQYSRLDTCDVVGLFSLLGTAAFALVLAHGLLVVQGKEALAMAHMLECLAPAVALSALGLLTAGLTVARGLTADNDEGSPKDEAIEAYRMAGTAVGLVGLAVLLAAMGLAWPSPLSMIAVGLLATAALVWSAFRYSLPVMHAGAIASISLVALVGYQTIVGRLLSIPREELPAEMLRLVTSASSGNVLAAVFVAMAVVAELLVRRGLRRHGVIYLGGCAVLAAVGLSLVTWHGFASNADTLRAAILFGLYASVCLGLAARWRNAMFADAGVWLAAGSLLWAAWWADLPLAGAFLVHASVAGLALLVFRLSITAKDAANFGIPSLERDDGDAHSWESMAAALRAWMTGTHQSATAGLSSSASRKPQQKHCWTSQQWHPTLKKELRPSESKAVVFSKALLLGAFCSSILAAPALVIMSPQTTLAAAGFVCWIAAVWMLIGSLVQRATIVAAAQAALSLAAMLASAAWIEQQNLSLNSPLSLQAYLLPLAALGLAWAGIRIALRQVPAAERLLNPSWLPVDMAVQYTVVCCQFVAAACWLIIACGGEFFGLTRNVAIAQVHDGCGLGAWLVVIVLGGWAFISLWNRWRDSELAATIVITLTVPCLLASAFVNDLASASAARWALAACFAICSVPVWYRRDVSRLLTGIGAKLELSPTADRLARGMIVTAAGGTSVALTVFAAVFELVGNRAVGPMAGSIFERLGPQVSYLIPLATVILVLVGYAIRERSSAYAFMAGLVVELTVVLGYALSVTLAGSVDSPRFQITLLQLATITAAAWAGLWLAARRWVSFWREDTTKPAATVLVNVQLAMALVGNMLLLLPAFAMLSLASRWFDEWIGAVGLPAGWVALILTVAVTLWHGIQRQRTGSLANFIGIAGMAAVGLLACSVQQYCMVFNVEGSWSYRTLMIGWAMYSLTIVLATWWASLLLTEDKADGPPRILVRAASVWVALSGILAVLLGLKAAFLHSDQLWAAMAISVSSLAGAVMAVWLRREWWAFTSALGVNLAASLVVWHVQLSTPFEDWWVMLIQANVIASALVALVWLAARSGIKHLRGLADGVGPLLSTQILMAAAGNAILLALPVGHLIRAPASLPQWMHQLCGPAGWTALLLTVAAAAWLEGRLQMRHLVHVLASLAVGSVILTACGFPPLLVKSATMASGGPTIDWMALHILVGGLTVIVLLITTLGIVGRKIQLRGQQLFAPSAVCGWALALSLAAFVFTLRCCQADPWGPWGPAAIVMLLSLAAGAIGVWRRIPDVVYISAALVNVAGTIIWANPRTAEWMPHGLETFLEVNAICLAATAVLWSLIDMFAKQKLSAVRWGNLQWPYAQAAIRVALSLLAALAAMLVFQSAMGIEHAMPERFTWISLASVAAALVVLAWDRSSWITLSGMYILGLVTLALGLVSVEWVWTQPGLTNMVWLGTITLAAFALVAALAAWALPRLWPLWQSLAIRSQSRGLPIPWFTVSQLIVVTTSAVGAVCIAVDFKFQDAGHPTLAWLSGRLFAPVAVAALLAAAMLMAQHMKLYWRNAWQYVALASTALLLACLGWALLPVDQTAPWLHRAAVLMIASTGATLLSSVGLRGLLPKSSDWIAAATRVAIPLAGLALASLAVVLTLEIKLFERSFGPPTALWAELSVAAALAALCGGCLCLAVIPRLDPFGLSQRGRTLYVYAAEALLVLLCLHVRMTMPELFHHLGFIRRYWMLIVMAVAFCGAGLSELFNRMRQPVLSEPLANTALVAPLLPAVGFWFMPAATPAMWFLMGLFYGMMAIMKRSFTLAGLAFISANMGLWVLWDKLSLSFFEHPQIWLIPGALAVLVAGHLHRHRLSEAQNVGLRWAALGVIYVSSTADMFIAGIGHSVAMPLVLAVLSVAGVLAGILFRVRSFLYLGTTFLALVIVTMIKYAAWDCQQMWILWSCCILLGAGVIGLFALFEKRRNDVLAAVERLKEWEA